MSADWLLGWLCCWPLVKGSTKIVGRGWKEVYHPDGKNRETTEYVVDKLGDYIAKCDVPAKA